MEPALRLDVLIAHPAYGGNGGIASEHPDIREWEVETVLKLRKDPRIRRCMTKTISDTPITMVRNQFVRMARTLGAHLLLMVDSDQSPNKHAQEAWFKPFWDVAFEEIYAHYQRGPLVIGAPYCGPPDGSENVYVFQFDNYGNRGDETMFTLEQYTRAQAAMMTGVSEVAALPTGCILFDMRIFDICEPSKLTKEQVLRELEAGKLTHTEALAALEDGWFFYEWKNQYADEKASTEDVASTRNMMFQCLRKHGYNPLRCTWDSWVGHHKPWNVGRPRLHTVEHISASFRRAIENEQSESARLIDFTSINSLKNVKVAGALPAGFPHDVLRGLSTQVKVHVRTLFGHDVVTFCHMTNDEHLHYLRNAIEAESIRVGRKLKVIEVGTWTGDSAVSIAPFCEKLFCVDNFIGPAGEDWQLHVQEALGGKDTVRETFLWNTRYFPQIKLLEGDSLELALQSHESLRGSFDVVIIDADHSYEGAKRDIESWLPMVRTGGLMIGHDYQTNQFPGVDRAVHEVFKNDGVTSFGSNKNGAYWMKRVEEGDLAHVRS